VDRPYIYALIDTRDKSIFYIGKGYKNRVIDHLKGRSHSPLVQKRIAEIRAENLEPDMRVLEFDTHEEAFAAEAKLIRHVRETTNTLVNRTGGGGGAKKGGHTPSDEYRASQGEKSRANWTKTDYREKVQAALAEANADPAVRAKRVEAQRQRFADPEKRAKAVATITANNKSEHIRHKRREQMLQRFQDPEARAKFAASGRRAMEDPEIRSRVSATRKAQWADPEQRAKRMAAIMAAHATKWFWVEGTRFDRVADAAAHFNVSDTTIHNWIKTGKAYVEPRNTAQ
jgi:hypothetical protein